MPSRTVSYEGFRQGIDRSQGDYPGDPTTLRAGENIVLTSGRQIEMRPPRKRLDVDLDPQTQGYVYAGCKHCVIARRGDTIVHEGSDAGLITTLFFDTPDYCDGAWTLLGAKPFGNRVVADILHEFPGCGFDGLIYRHSLDPADPLRNDPKIAKPTYVEDPWCPTNWTPTRPLHYFGKGEIGAFAPGFLPVTAPVTEKLVSSRPDGNVAFSGVANERVWNAMKVSDLEDVGEMWYWLTPNNGQTLLQFTVSDRYDKLDDDRAWTGYVLEYLDEEGRWQKFIETNSEPNFDRTYTARAVDGRFGDRYNEICLRVRWEGPPCTWIRWRATIGGPALSVLDGGELIDDDVTDSREYPGDGSQTSFLTDISRPVFRVHWGVELERDEGATDLLIPLILGAQFHYVQTPVDAPRVAWAATTGYTENEDFVSPSTANGFWYQCVQTGVSGGAEPAWPVVAGGTVVDGTVTWLARSVVDDLSLTRIDFTKHRGRIDTRCNTVDPEFRYTTNLRYETLQYVPVFLPTLWLNEAEDVLVPDTDYELDNDEGFIRVTWVDNVPAAGTVWTLKFAPTADDTVVAARSPRHLTGGSYTFEAEVWDFAAINVRGTPADSSLLVGVPHVPLVFGAAGATGEGGNALFDAAGSYNFVVPDGVTSLVIDGRGPDGGGGGSDSRAMFFFAEKRVVAGGGGGGGAHGTLTIPVTPGEILTVEVGAGGAAGASIVRRDAFVLTPICGGPKASGSNGGSTRVLRGAVVLFEMGGGLGGEVGDAGAGLGGWPPTSGVGGAGGTPVLPATGAPGTAGGTGGFGRQLGGAWPPAPINGGAAGLSGDGFVAGGVGANGRTTTGFPAVEGCACPNPCEPSAGQDGRVLLVWGETLNPWFVDPTGVGMPMTGYQRYYTGIRNRVTTDAAGLVAGSSVYEYGNEPGRESLFFIEKQVRYRTVAGDQDAGFIDTAAREQGCGAVIALSGIKNRLGVHYAGVTYLYAFEKDPVANAFLDRLHFGSRGPTADFFGGVMLLTQLSFRILDLGGLNYDSLRDNNVGRPIEDLPVEAIHAAQYWPALGVYTAAVTLGGEERMLFFCFSREGKVAGWVEAIVRDFVRPVIDSLHDVDDRLYYRAEDRLYYFNASAGDGTWFDDVDLEAYEDAVAAETDPIERDKLRLEQFKYPARARFNLNDLGDAATMKRWLWMDVEQRGCATTGFYERPEDDARRKLGPTYAGNSLHRRRSPLVMRNQALGLELVSRDLDGWRLHKIILGVAQSRR